MSKTIKRRRNTYFVIAVILVSFLFTYYFFSYIPQRESDLDNRGVRVMNRMTRNLMEREDHYRRSLNLFECDYLVRAYAMSLDEGGEETEIDESDIKNQVLFSGKCGTIGRRIAEMARDMEGTWAARQKAASRKYISSSINADPIVQLIPLSKGGQFAYVDTIQVRNKDYALAISSEDFAQEVKQYEFFTDIFLTDPETHQVLDYSKLGFKYFNYIPSVEAESDADTLQNGLIKDESGVFLVPNVDINMRNIADNKLLTFTTNVTIQGKSYYLHGLLEESKYNDMVRSVSIWVVVVSVVLLLFLIQILPIIKPFVITSKERLSGVDVIWSTIALVFGISALSILLVGIDTFAVEDINLIDKKLNRYGDNISRDFKQERDTLINILQRVELIDATDLGGDWQVDSTNTRILDIGEDGTANFYEFGSNDKLRLLSNDLDLSHRNYFKVLSDETELDLWRDPNDTVNYYVESLFSLSKGAYETVLGIRKADKIRAAVRAFQSVNNLYLEPNYQFAIVDQQGTIHYHSQQSKIKNENIIEESNHDEDLIAYLNNSSERSFPIEVSLHDYRAHIQPITGTPWYVITMYDIRKSRLTVTSSMVTAFIIILMILVYLFVLHLLFKVSSNRASTAKERNFLYLFLSPIKTPSKVYHYLALGNAITILFILFIYWFNPIVLGYSIVAYMGILSTSILLNYIVLIKRSRDIDAVIGKTMSKGLSIFEISLFCFSLIWLIAQIVITKESHFLAVIIILYQIAQFLLYLFLRIRRDYLILLPSTVEKRNYTNFYLHTLSWVLMISFIPAILFFKPIYNLQHISLGLDSWMQELYYKNTNNILLNKKTYIFNTPADSGKLVSPKSLYTSLNLIEALRPGFDAELGKLKGLQDNMMNKQEVRRGRDKELGLPFYEVKSNASTHFSSNRSPDPNKVVAFALPNVFRGSSYSLIFWVILALGLIVIYVTIRKLSENFFYLNLLEHLLAVKSKRAFGTVDQENALINADLVKDQKNIMLVGPPYSGRNRLAKSLISTDKKLIYIDFLNDVEKEAEKVQEMIGAYDESEAQPIIINNFDYRVYDFDRNRKKLKIIEQIIRFRNEQQIEERLIFICHFGTSQLIDIYLNQIRDLKRIKANASEIEQLEQDMYGWESVLFGFITHIVALSQNYSYDWIDRELDHGSELQQLNAQVRLFEKRIDESNIVLSEYEKRERIIDAIRDMAQNLYYSIWSSCTRAERFLLYDMAQDGLVNSKSEKVIVSLVRKGILTPEPSLTIFNVSFSRFVIENISEEEGTLMERESKKDGIFSSYRFFVIFLIIIIIVFLSFVERSTVARIMGVLTLSASLLPRILGSIGSMNAANFSFKKKGGD
jgi:hypothetical protein